MEVLIEKGKKNQQGISTSHPNFIGGVLWITLSASGGNSTLEDFLLRGGVEDLRCNM